MKLLNTVGVNAKNIKIAHPFYDLSCFNNKYRIKQIGKSI